MSSLTLPPNFWYLFHFQNFPLPLETTNSSALTANDIKRWVEQSQAFDIFSWEEFLNWNLEKRLAA